jgi:hypothetical protein
MTCVSRQPARAGLATLLETALVGTGLPVQAVYAYQVGDFQGQSPVVVVTSGPMERIRDTMGECYRSRFNLMVYVFVLYADPGTAWGEDDAEDALDAIEALIADVLLTNTRTANWTRLEYSGATDVDAVVIGGVEYRRELITLTAEVL